MLIKSQIGKVNVLLMEEIAVERGEGGRKGERESAWHVNLI